MAKGKGMDRLIRVTDQISLGVWGKTFALERVAFHQRVLEEILDQRVESSRNRRNSHCVKRKIGNFPLRRACAQPWPRGDIETAIRIINLDSS